MDLNDFKSLAILKTLKDLKTLRDPKFLEFEKAYKTYSIKENITTTPSM
jgi:hypothetical protein